MTTAPHGMHSTSSSFSIRRSGRSGVQDAAPPARDAWASTVALGMAKTTSRMGHTGFGDAIPEAGLLDELEVEPLPLVPAKKVVSALGQARQDLQVSRRGWTKKGSSACECG